MVPQSCGSQKLWVNENCTVFCNVWVHAEKVIKEEAFPKK